MKKIFETLVALIVVVALILACGENPDGSCNLKWSLSCLLIAAIVGIVWNKVFDKTIHVPYEVYDDLNKQIEDYAMGMGDGCDIFHAFSSFNEIDVTLKVCLRSSVSEITFTDYAWGHPKDFVEKNRRCIVEILHVEAINKNAQPVNTDFNEGLIEIEYESSNWE